jgi:alpha-beta hydrolase superfamily lysophospholipase
MRTSIENTFPTTDGSALFYRYYPARGPRPRGAILLFHRGHEHSGRVAHLVEQLDLPDFAFFAWDARGHGRSPGPRGDTPSVTTSVEDIQAFVDWVISHHAFTAEEVAVIGQSVAGALLAAWAHDYAPPIRAMVLAAPAFRIRLYVPFARAGLRLLRARRGNVFVNSYVKARHLTHDSERIASYDADPLITRAVSTNVLLGLHDLSKRVVDHRPYAASDRGPRLRGRCAATTRVLRATRRTDERAAYLRRLLPRCARRTGSRASPRQDPCVP